MIEHLPTAMRNMTLLSPVDDLHETSCTGEAKTDYLTLCSGTGGAFHQINNNRNNSALCPLSEPRKPTANNRLAMLKGGCMPPMHPPKPADRLNTKSRCSGGSLANKLPRLVKVSVYTKAASPYLVIYDSNRKYSKPAACVKLVNSAITRCCHGTDDCRQGADDCSFLVVPGNHMDDADSTNAITLRASSPEKCDEWVELLSQLAKGGLSSSEAIVGYVPGSSVMPTLDERDDDDIEDITNTVDCLKASAREKSRKGRRSSLNSLGIRLRSYGVKNRR